MAAKKTAANSRRAGAQKDLMTRDRARNDDALLQLNLKQKRLEKAATTLIYLLPLTMSSVGSNENEEKSISDEEAKVLLVEKLKETRSTSSTNAPPSLDALFEIHTLLGGNEFDQSLFVGDVFEVVVNATKHPAADVEIQRIAAGVCCPLLCEEREESAISFIEHGGLPLFGDYGVV